MTDEPTTTNGSPKGLKADSTVPEILPESENTGNQETTSISRRRLLQKGAAAASGLAIGGLWSTPTRAQDSPGYLGTYYNLSPPHPDINDRITGVVTGLVEPSLPLRLTSRGEQYINQFDWFNSQYRVFTKRDQTLNWPYNFFPIPSEKEGDPAHFAVHWTARVIATEEGTYQFSVASDDDAWVFLNGQLILDRGGVHALSGQTTSINLDRGTHNLDIYFADRYVVQSGLVFRPDARLMAVPGTG